MAFALNLKMLRGIRLSKYFILLASSAGTCSYTIQKASADICQLRLDFQTFSGFAVPTGGQTKLSCRCLNPNRAGLLDVAWEGGGQKPNFYFLKVHNELGKVTKFWNSRPLFSWRNSHLKKVRADSARPNRVKKCNFGRLYNSGKAALETLFSLFIHLIIKMIVNFQLFLEHAHTTFLTT